MSGGNPYHDSKTGEFTSGPDHLHESLGHNAGKVNRSLVNRITGQHMRFEPTVVELATKMIVAIDSAGKTFVSRKPQQVIDHIAKNFPPSDVLHMMSKLKKDT